MARILILGTGFGGLGLSTVLSEGLGDDAKVTLIDRGDAPVFGEGRIGSVDIDFLSGPEKTGHFNPPSPEQMALKDSFGATRRARWFDL